MDLPDAITRRGDIGAWGHRETVLADAHTAENAPIPWNDDEALRVWVIALRGLVRRLVYQLERDDTITGRNGQADTNRRGIARSREALATGRVARKRCHGSGGLVNEERCDGNGVATCRMCGGYRPTEPIAGGRTWRRFEEHGIYTQSYVAQRAAETDRDDLVDEAMGVL